VFEGDLRASYLLYDTFYQILKEYISDRRPERVKEGAFF
jgi:hypothetical protein